DQARIFGQRAGTVPRRPRLPCLPPRGEFLVVNQEIHAARAGIVPDAVALVHEGQRPADEGFRRDIADAHPPRGAGKTAVGDERHLLTHALSVNQRGDAQHLPHPGAADRALIADDENLTFAVFAIANGIDAVFLVLEHPRGALEYPVLDAGTLDDGPVRTEIALQDRAASVRHDRLADAENDLAVGRIGPAIFLGNRPAGNRQAEAVDVTAFDQRADNDGSAADVINILRGVFPAR